MQGLSLRASLTCPTRLAIGPVSTMCLWYKRTSRSFLLVLWLWHASAKRHPKSTVLPNKDHFQDRHPANLTCYPKSLTICSVARTALSLRTAQPQGHHSADSDVMAPLETWNMPGLTIGLQCHSCFCICLLPTRLPSLQHHWASLQSSNTMCYSGLYSANWNILPSPAYRGPHADGPLT